MTRQTGVEPDWRGIFRRYVEVVGEAEGVDFLYREDWSEEEWDAFSSLWPGDQRFRPERTSTASTTDDFSRAVEAPLSNPWPHQAPDDKVTP